MAESDQTLSTRARHPAVTTHFYHSLRSGDCRSAEIAILSNPKRSLLCIMTTLYSEEDGGAEDVAPVFVSREVCDREK